MEVMQCEIIKEPFHFWCLCIYRRCIQFL